MRASVVIPVHNGARFLTRCLGALLSQEGADFEVIAVDNGSSDGSAALIRAEFPQVRLVESPRALGFSGAVNAGLHLALEGDADALLILNQDTEVHPGWLATLVAALERDPRLGIVGCKALFPNGRLQHTGGEIQLPLGYGRNRGYNQPDTQAAPETEPDFLSGVALAMRRAMLAQIGLFDEGFNPAYFEDVDLCYRARAAGWGLRYEPNAVLTHNEGAAAAAGDYGHAALIERNRLRLQLKHTPLDRLLNEFFPAELAQLKQRIHQDSATILRRAYLDGLLMLPDLDRSGGEMVALREMLVELRRQAIRMERGGSASRPAPPAEPRISEWTQAGPGAGTASQGSADSYDDGRRTTDDGQTAQTRSSVVGRPSSRTPNGSSKSRTDEPVPTTVAAEQTEIRVLPPVAIIMLTWNGLHYTRECLESLRELTTGLEYQVIVVDNGSTDGTREYLRGLGWVTLIENETNEGYVRGNNRGIAAAPAGWDVVLLNNDMRIIQANWLARLREVAHSDPAYGVVGCRLIMGDGKLLHAGTYMPTDSFWGWQIGGGEEDIGQYAGVREVDGIVGACMYLRRDVVEKVGVLDERYFSYFEDTDYCLRAKQAGYAIVVAGDVNIVHYENVSTKLNKVNFWGIFGRSQQIFLDRWEGYYRGRYRHKLFWHSLVSAPTGYASSSKQLLVAMDRQDVDCRLAYLYGTDFSERHSGDPRVEQMRYRPKDTSLVQVVYNQCDAFHKNSGSYRIGYSMLEVTGIPEDWVHQSNLMDEVWVPSHFNVETFRNSGVSRPIHVIPLGIDPNYFHPQIKARRFSEKFTFLSVFEWGERKAPELLLRAFTTAFSDKDDVVLVLKTDNRDGDVNVAQQIAALGLPPNAPKIVLLYNQELPGYQLGSLYRGADCFVLPTRGEGWGMPILEAMACGLPVIATNWSAQTEFIRDDICYPIQAKRLIPAVAKCPYYAGYEWADPDFEQLVYLMRQVYEQREEACALGQRAAEHVAREWTWDRAAEKVIARLREIGA